MVGLVIIIIFVLFIGLCIGLIAKTSSDAKEQSQKIDKLKKPELIFSTLFNHYEGLPIAKHALCHVWLYPDRIEFVNENLHASIQKDRLTDVGFSGDVQKHDQYVSSVGGAVAGAVLFGPVGAAVGGRAKKKTSTTGNVYLVFTYKSLDNKEIKSISFVCAAYDKRAERFINDFKQSGQVTEMSL